ncbi:MAG: hypothetical protein EOO42_05710 [Flavobacteriales bacterium]|nr:MAG: hypothetical protein EOO42_05710 [Flavobacteriales bacterium]
MLKKFVIFLLLLAPMHLLAQNGFLTGNVFDNENRGTALEGVTIKNLNTKSLVITDKDGHYALSAKVGDLVSFAMVGYQTDTIYLTKLVVKNVYMRAAVNTLNAVDITSTKISPYLNTKDPNAVAAKEVEYSKERGGLRLNLGFGKQRRQNEKVQALEEYDRFQEEINRNFNEKYIKTLVKFQGQNIRDFIDMYRPTVEQVKSERPFNYDYYISSSYSAWLKLPADQRKLPSLLKKGNQ